ncbi:MAG: hypothetical protein P0Y60_14035 [Candidatus Microbacterium colombiense]|nr:MAG: hypothetical protein P0Y60_14035 [Microbacterium sp.]
MTATNTSDARIARSVDRWFVRYPLILGSTLLLAAIGFTVAGDDLSFFPFLMMLVGGWCFGFAFVNRTMDMVPVRGGVVLHVAVAVGLAALLVIVLEFAGDMLSTFPDAARAVVVVLQMAAIPAAGWIWLGLLARVSDLFTRRDAKKPPPPVPPEWERDETGDGSIVKFPALELRMRRLTQMIVVIVVVAGGVTTALLIVLDDVVMRLGARLAILLVGVVIALPVYLVFTAVLRRRTASCSVAFGNDELRVTVGETLHVIAFRDLQHLRWRCRSDYARLELRGPDVDLSLVAGLAKPPAGFSAELPALPRRVFRRLELAGLAMTKERRGEVVTFTRAPGPA